MTDSCTYQNTASYAVAKKAIEKTLADNKLELREFQRTSLGVLYADVIWQYKNQADAFPGGIRALQKTLDRLYPKLDIWLDGMVWAKTIRALVQFQMDNGLSDEYGTIGCNTVMKLLGLTSEWKTKESTNSLSESPSVHSLDSRAAKNTSEYFLTLVRNEWGKITADIRRLFYQVADKIPTEKLQSFLTSLDPLEVKNLLWGNQMKMKKILSRLKDETISRAMVSEIISKHFSKEEDDHGESESSGMGSEKEKQIKQRYQDLTENLRKWFGMAPEELFAKLFIHESWGSKEQWTIRIFAASGTGSIGPCQTTSSTYTNDILPAKFNPFNPETAIPWAISFFLLENYTEQNHKIAVQKAKIYAQWHQRPDQIMRDAHAGKYDVIVALDRYNKWNAGSAKISLADMLGKSTQKSSHDNPYNYSCEVLDTCKK